MFIVYAIDIVMLLWIAYTIHRFPSDMEAIRRHYRVGLMGELWISIVEAGFFWITSLCMIAFFFLFSFWYLHFSLSGFLRF